MGIDPEGPATPLRILYVLHGYKPAYRLGGPVVSAASTAEILVSRGHHVTVFTTDSNLDENLDVATDRPIDVHGVEVWYFRRRDRVPRWARRLGYVTGSVGFLYTPQMRRELERLVPQMDLVHTQMPFVYPTYAAGRAALRLRRPLFYSQHGVFDPGRLRFRAAKKMLYVRAVEAPIMRRATTLVGLTQAELKSYRRLGIETPCRVVPNGVNVHAFRTTAHPATLSRCGIASDALVVLFLGRLHPTKGVDVLVQAFVQMRGALPRAVLVFAGPDECGLRRRVTAMLGEDASVKFVGMVDGDEKRELLARADLFCLPSAGEGFSVAVLEALASGTPVLLSPGCNFPEVETAGVGMVAAPQPQAVAHALRDLLGRPAELREMGTRARAFVEQHYSWEHIVNQLLRVYREGIDRHWASAGARASWDGTTARTASC